MKGLASNRALAGGAHVPTGVVVFYHRKVHTMNPTDRFYFSVALVLGALVWLVVTLVQSAGGAS